MTDADPETCERARILANALCEDMRQRMEHTNPIDIIAGLCTAIAIMAAMAFEDAGDCPSFIDDILGALDDTGAPN